jgi:addiction module RelB/DinJ family antitoxin
VDYVVTIVYNIDIMSTVLHVKLDEGLKKEAQETARELGLPLSTVVASSLREFVKTRTITVSGTPRLKPDIENELLRRSDDAKKGKNLSPTFENLDDAKRWLES